MPESSDPSDAREDIHPRIERRRREVGRRSLRRNWRRWGALAVAVLLTLVVAGLFSPLFDLDHLDVTGVEGAPSDAVVQASGLTEGTAMFGIRPADVRARVESLPWIAHADVDARWPDRVSISVTPQRPVAVFGHGPAGPGAILTSTGAVLSPQEAGPLTAFAGGAPRVEVDPAYDPAKARAVRGVGPEPSRIALAVLTQLRPVTVALDQRLDIGPGGNVTLEATLPGAEDPARLVLGSPDDLPAKATALESVLSGPVELACVDRVDVSVPTRVTIQRSQGCTIPDPGTG